MHAIGVMSALKRREIKFAAERHITGASCLHEQRNYSAKTMEEHLKLKEQRSKVPVRRLWVLARAVHIEESKSDGGSALHGSEDKRSKGKPALARTFLGVFPFCI